MSCRSRLSIDSGSHPSLIVQAEAEGSPTSCRFHVGFDLPAEGFIDLYELSTRIPDYNITYRHDLGSEEPTIVGSAVQRTTVDAQNSSSFLDLEIPFHMRYPAPLKLERSSSREQTPTASIQRTVIEWPTVSWSCSSLAGSHHGEPTTTGSAVCTGAQPLAIHVPLPDVQMSKFVEATTICTELSLLLIVMYYIRTLSFLHPQATVKR
ncbi:uncharacterized protein FOMMEDRAFT_168618 [Fomitiporia mediterranea MF3/22]|uniref:uncharacterized protein n=1 Tax=Fomitiporia mediterranea (strain MF3/22) TaxID=694068 RepID=UPI0004407CBF|nr:uncharacterized protein FOMMEDRAFT_168618 [Fomitiporia mediterranea MF3/22]EJD02067.1 hypothetical protein FOMMEDRAFT_168618 [Fomitiporia mediterranea MF3/22]